jgi:hypothetical protein
MFRNFRDRITLFGITVLSLGLGLLVFTFVSAYGFVSENLQMFSSQDLAQTFGETLAPLIAASIRIMYLGVMGWIGSLVTIRGVTILANVPKPEAGVTQSQVLPQKLQPQQQTKAKVEKEAKPEAKRAEPELVVIPLEQVERQQNSRASS